MWSAIRALDKNSKSSHYLRPELAKRRSERYALYPGKSELKEKVMKVSFPAMRGTIGQRTYYSCLMKLNAIPKMFTFRDWVEFTPEEREQRLLNKKRVPDIARYILDNEEGFLFASITASYKCD